MDKTSVKEEVTVQNPLTKLGESMKIERLRFSRAIGGRNMNPLSIQKRIRDV